MVDNIKFNKVLPTLSSAPKVKRADQRSGREQQNAFEETLKKRRRNKKKKEELEHANIADDCDTADNGPAAPTATGKGADEGEKTADSASNRKIDIRV